MRPINCPWCGNLATVTRGATLTLILAGVIFTARERHCRPCGQRFQTVEGRRRDVARLIADATANGKARPASQEQAGPHPLTAEKGQEQRV
jgi:hypothetical protein